MALLDDVKGIIGNLAKPVDLTPPMQFPILTKQEPPKAPATYTPLIKLPKWGDPEGAISEMIAGIASQGKAAPGTMLDRDLAKIGSFAMVEAAIGALEELSPSMAFLMGGLLNAISEAILGPNFRDLEYQGNFSNPNKQLAVPDAVNAYFRGRKSKEELMGELRKEGYSALEGENIIEVSKTLLNLGDLIDLRLRGIISTDAELEKRAGKLGYDPHEAHDALETRRPLIPPGQTVEMYRRRVVNPGDVDSFDDLRRAGWTEARIEALKSISTTLPNVFNIQDFAVRQVDNPDIVKKFDLDFLRDEKYMEGARKLGYTDEDAIRIYRYYWEYPPFFQVARLYTAGKIPEADFRDVLGFLRFTPYWQDRLVDDMKPRLTESEIKDLYKYSMLNESELIDELVDVGMPRNLATKRAALIVASVKHANPVDQTAQQQQAEKIKGETIGLVKTAYMDGVINRAQVQTDLTKLGYPQEVIDLELAIADYKVQQDHIKSLFSALKDNVAAGVISTNDALTQLSEAGATADQLTVYAAQLQRVVTHKPTLPTKAEFEAWFKKGIITANDLAQGLSLNGVSDTWLPYYMEHAGVAPAQIQSILNT